MKKPVFYAAIVAAAAAVASSAALGFFYWERYQAKKDLDEVGITYSEASFIDEACAGNRAGVVLFLKTGMNPLTRGKDDLTALHCAARNGQDKLMLMLIRRGIDVNVKTREDRTPLHEAATRGSIEATKVLLDNKAAINATDKNGDTPLTVAAGRKAEIISLLIEKGADVKAKNKNGDTALSKLMNYGGSKETLEAIENLINKGADVNATTNDGRTPLQSAISYGQRPLIEKLIAAGANVNAKSNNGTILMHAASRPDMVKLLLDNKADPNLAADDGSTALDRAARAGSLESLKLLLEAGARVDTAPGKDGVLHMAAAAANPEILGILLKRGVDPNTRGRYGMTPLHALVASAFNSNDPNRIACARMLISFGAELDATDQNGRTPAMMAQAMRAEALADALMSPSARKSSASRTPPPAAPLMTGYAPHPVPPLPPAPTRMRQERLAPVPR